MNQEQWIARGKRVLNSQVGLAVEACKAAIASSESLLKGRKVSSTTAGRIRRIFKSKNVRAINNITAAIEAAETVLPKGPARVIKITGLKSR